MNGKKTSKFSILLILIYFSSFEAHSQWNQTCYFPLPQPQFPPPTYNITFLDAEFSSKDTGIYAYHEYFTPSGPKSVTLKQTSDAALTWTGTSGWSNNLGVSLAGIYRLPFSSTYFAIKDDSGIDYALISPDGGMTWQQPVLIGTQVSGFFACDTSKYYSFHTNGPPPFYYLFKYDHGNKYMQYASFTMKPIHPFFPDTAVGYVIVKGPSVSYYGTIMKTIDGGINWLNVFNDSTVNIRKTFFVDTLTGYACGDSGLIIKTIDGGASWQYLNSGVNINLNSIYCLDGSFVLAAGDLGTIIRTTDGGVTWTQDQTATMQNFLKIYVVSDSIGMAMTDGYQYSQNIYVTGVWENLHPWKDPVNVFPNPASDVISFYFEPNLQNSSCDLMVCDNMGKHIRKKSFIINQSGNSMDVSHFSEGVYFLIFQCGEKKYRKTMVISN